MRMKYVSALVIFLALVITVPALTSCEQIVGYLIYEWIDNEFNDDDDEDREDPQIYSVSVDREIIYTGESVVLEEE